jgi:hypothetical protein
VTTAGETTRAADGMTLAAGDRVVTSNGIALVTFLSERSTVICRVSPPRSRRAGSSRTQRLTDGDRQWPMTLPTRRCSASSNTMR